MSDTPAEHSQGERLKGFNFDRLGERERALAEELGSFTFQHSFLGLLKKQYGNTNVKEKFIDSNRMFLDQNDLAVLNEETLKYKKQSSEGSLVITSLFTVSALLYGIIALPARKSPLKYTVTGLGVGLLVSYGFWRLQLYRFDEKINLLFKKVLRDQYELQQGKKM
jgi:hypothetical protein